MGCGVGLVVYICICEYICVCVYVCMYVCSMGMELACRSGTSNLVLVVVLNESEQVAFYNRWA